jgi:hypothetical protein
LKLSRSIITTASPPPASRAVRIASLARRMNVLRLGSAVSSSVAAWRRASANPRMSRKASPIGTTGRDQREIGQRERQRVQPVPVARLQQSERGEREPGGHDQHRPAVEVRRVVFGFLLPGRECQ